MGKRKSGLSPSAGLDSLLGADVNTVKEITTISSSSSMTTELKLKQLKPGKYQPRQSMDDETLKELAESIKSQGVMQPLLVRPLFKGNYEIIAGERRFRAAKLAGLNSVPVLVRQVDDKTAAIMALIENMQREDLNPIDEAKGLKRLIDEFRFTHEQAAEVVGRSRSFVTNLLRLLTLSEPVQKLLEEKKLDIGHARPIATLDNANQILVASQIVQQSLSVRETEQLIKEVQRKPVKKNKKRMDPDVRKFQNDLSNVLGTTVSIQVNSRHQGTLSIKFSDWEHLNSLLERMNLLEVDDN